jgi:uncharacterized protein YndB with AHSA1/START domain/heme-degrading monooxygenase HmoA
VIARVWRGWVRTERLAEYVAIVDRTGLAGCRRTPGNAGAQLLTRDLGEGRTELITISWWTDLQHIKSFAGEDIELAIYYPEDDEYLLDRESTVAHFEVTPPREVPAGVQPDAGTPAFTLTRVYPAVPSVVFAHFTEPAPFCRWFVVDGHTTPPDRVTLDARPGGRISGTMVAQQDGQEIPFSATYGRVEPPWTVQFEFSGPPEVVTMTLTDLGAAGTQLTYRNEGCPPEDRAEALVGVGRMLDALEASLTGAAR